MAYGRKRWFVWPPSQAFYRKDTAMHWARADLQKHCASCAAAKKSNAGVGAPPTPHPCPIEFDQLPGDIVYVPDSFAHATVNIQTSIGFAVEFDTAASTAWGSARYASDAMKPIPNGAN